MDQSKINLLNEITDKTASMIKIIDGFPMEHRVTVIIALALSLGPDDALKVWGRLPEAVMEYEVTRLWREKTNHTKM